MSDDDRRDERHDGNAPQQRVGNDEHHDETGHQHAGRPENIEPPKRNEEDAQRPEFEREFQSRIDGPAFGRRCALAVSHSRDSPVQYPNVLATGFSLLQQKTRGTGRK